MAFRKYDPPMASISCSVSHSKFNSVGDPAGPLTPKAAANLKNRIGFKLYFIPCIQVPSETVWDTKWGNGERKGDDT